MSGFSAFRPEAIQFLAELSANNERAWFQPRKADYERLLKEPLESLCAALSERAAARGLPFQVDPRRSPFRFYRDTRFSRDKSPYKTHVGASFPYLGGTVAVRAGGGAAEAGASEGPRGNGGYFSFGPGEMVVGGGMWDPGKERIERFRALVINDPDRVRAALEEAGFVREYGAAYALESLKRVPPGLPADHPMADRLRWKDVVFIRQLSDDEALSPGLPDTIADAFAAALPVFAFLASLG